MTLDLNPSGTRGRQELTSKMLNGSPARSSAWLFACALPTSHRLASRVQDTAHVMSKVDKLLGEVRGSAGGGAAPAGAGVAALPPEDLEAHCRLLDRVASEVSRLQFYAAKGGELEFMRQLQPRIDGAAAALQVGLFKRHWVACVHLAHLWMLLPEPCGTSLHSSSAHPLMPSLPVLLPCTA